MADNILLIIITAFLSSMVTGIITNFVFLRYQKQVESNFAKQLEEFRLKLQLSNFQEQTKFVRNHEKMVETLETLYKKYSTISAISTSRLLNVEEFGGKTIGRVKDDLDLDSFIESIDDIQEYFAQNKIYLAEDSVSLVYSIIHKTVLLSMIVKMLELTSRDKELFSSYVEVLEDGEFTSGEIDLKKLIGDEFNIGKFLNRVAFQIQGYQEQIEKQYREYGL